MLFRAFADEWFESGIKTSMFLLLKSSSNSGLWEVASQWLSDQVSRWTRWQGQRQQILQLLLKIKQIKHKKQEQTEHSVNRIRKNIRSLFRKSECPGTLWPPLTLPAPPLSSWPPGNASPDAIRSTSYYFPCEGQAALLSRLPLGALITPLAKQHSREVSENTAYSTMSNSDKNIKRYFLDELSGCCRYCSLPQREDMIIYF